MNNPQITRTIKIASLAFIGLVFSFFTFYFYRQLLAGAGGIWPLAIFSSLFILVAVMEALFVRPFSLVVFFLGASALIGAFNFSSFIFNGNFLVVFAFGLFFLGAIWGGRRGYNEMSNNINFRFVNAAIRVIAKTALGLVLAFTFLGYFYFFQLGGFNANLARGVYDKTVNFAAPLIQVWLPGLSFDDKVSDVIIKISKNQLFSVNESIRSESQFQSLPKSVQDALLRQITPSIQSYFTKIFGPSFNGNQSVRELTFNIIKDKVSNFGDPLLALIKIGLAVLAFFALEGIVVLLYYPLAWLGFIIFKILVTAGYLDPAYVSIQKEIYVI